MNREFQVVYQQMGKDPLIYGGIPCGPLLTVSFIAETADQAKTIVTGAGLHFISAVEVRPIVDWEKPLFTRDEVAAYLNVDPNTVSANKGDGKMPFCAIGKGGFPRRIVEKWVEESLNPPGKELLRKLKQA